MFMFQTFPHSLLPFSALPIISKFGCMCAIKLVKEVLLTAIKWTTIVWGKKNNRLNSNHRIGKVGIIVLLYFVLMLLYLAQLRRFWRQCEYQCRPLHRRQAAAARTRPADVHTSSRPRHNNSGADKLMFRRYPAVDLSSPGRLYNVLIITVISPIVLLFRLAS